MYLLFDIGGTNTRLAVTKDGQKLLGESVKIPTPQDFSEAVKIILKTAQDLSAGEKFIKAAGGAPGPMDKENTKLTNAPNLPKWNGLPLKQELEKALGCEVILQNDAAMAGVGEANFGAGKNYRIIAYVTISTGVGGARIVQGKVDESAKGFEPGHMIIINTQGEKQEIATLESLVSGTAIKNRFGKIATEISDKKVWDELAEYLAIGLNNLAVLWSPNIIILGGSVITKPGGMPIDLVNSHFQKICKIFPELPEIKKAALGDLSGIYGAMEMLTHNT